MPVTETASTSGGGSTNQHSDEWIRPSNKRKGSSPGLNNRMTKQSKITNWLGVPTTNRFGDLPVDDNPSSMVTDDNTGDSSTGRDQPKQPPPPPIFVHNVEQIQPLYTLLDEMAPNDYILKPFVNNQVKIQLKTIDLYRSVLKALQEKGTQLHSYQIKSERTFRVVLRNLHHSTDLTELKKQLAEKGHTVVNIHNVKHRISKQPLPIFYVNLTPNSNNSEIYKITTLVNCVVKFEAPHTKKVVPQCTRCQSFLHTKAFCCKLPRCVKCPGSHMTSDCNRKVKDNNVKCVNCGGDHPANYKGCPSYKSLRERLFPALRARRMSINASQHNTTPQRPSLSHTRNGVSFSSVLTGNISEEQPSSQMNNGQQSNDWNEMKDMMKNMMLQMTNIINLLTTFVTKKD
ncbi:uncharacterized protein DMENIID0001_017390 [Sergentomyia squamirostris]